MGKREDKSSCEVQATSSVPRVLPEEQQALFREVLTLFENVHLPYAVAGAFALRQHTGISRFTKDPDIFLSTQAASAALACLEKRGFQCEVCDPVWLAKVHRDDFFGDLIPGMSYAVIAVDDSLMVRANPAISCGVDTRVLAADDLLSSKLFVKRRERFDGADIAHIIFAS